MESVMEEIKASNIFKEAYAVQHIVQALMHLFCKTWVLNIICFAPPKINFVPSHMVVGDVPWHCEALLFEVVFQFWWEDALFR
jgi:hypothetical protein